MDLRFWSDWTDRRPPFVLRIPGAARTVILESLFRRSPSILCVDPQAPDAVLQMQRFGPAVIAGSLPAVGQLAGRVSPTHALVIFTREGERCLAAADRDSLWHNFGVPIFEQVITREGRLVAWECEAHAGLHLANGVESEAERLVVGMCDCGSAGTRMIGAPVAPSLTADPDLPALLLPATLGSQQRPIPT